MDWIQAAPISEVRKKGQALVRRGKRQIALFTVEGEVFAVDNRCPHEGYPLLQGTVDTKTCVLTCQWHNWRFRLESGECILGEDHVRSYPTKVADGFIYVDVTDPPAASYHDTILKGLEEAIEDRQYGRIAREISRLLLRGLDPLDGIRTAVRHTYDRFEYGTTHAYAAAADWIELYRREGLPERKVVCSTEAIDHIAHDALRHPTYPFAEKTAPFEGKAFLDAIEAEGEPRAMGLARGALDEGRLWSELEPWYSQVAFAHYNDFGHAAIYVSKAGALIEALGEAYTSLVVLPLTRMLCYTTRDDLLPDFAVYGEHLEGATATGQDAGKLVAPFGMSTKATLAWTGERLQRHAPPAIYSALFEASALNLLRFDERLDVAAKRTVSQNAGWLYFTHALTFANAVRVLCESQPELWPKALLQMACFVGRNKRYVNESADVAGWLVEDEAAFFANAEAQILDHGLLEPIFSAHLLKTTLAVEAALPFLSDGARRHGIGALNRFLKAPLKQKHPLRTARQALALTEASI